MDLYKIISQLTEEEFTEIYTTFTANKADKSASFLKIIRENPESPDKEFLVVQVTRKEIPEVDLDTASMNTAKQNFSRLFVNDLRWQYLYDLQMNADIDYNLPVRSRLLLT